MNFIKSNRRRSIVAAIILLASTALALSNLRIHTVSAQHTYDISIQDFALHPTSLEIYEGGTITFYNEDPVIYTLWFTRAKDETTYALSEPILPGESWSHTFEEPMVLQCYGLKHLWVNWIIKVKMLGDINGDGEVDHWDLKCLAKAYGSEVGDPNWDPQADLDPSGVIDHGDLKVLAKNYGRGQV